MKSDELLKLLNNDWMPPERAFIPEFRGGTGCAIEQRADAIAMNLWPSKGLELVGFEIKVSRSDWLREMKQPDKAYFMKRFCDRWYLVVSNLKIVKYADELPSGWGLMYAENGEIKTMIEAPKLLPEPVDKYFIASLMRRVSLSAPVNKSKE